MRIVVTIVAVTLSSSAAAQSASTVDGGMEPVRVCVGGDVTLGTNLDTSWVFRAAKWMGRQPPALPDPRTLVAPLVPMVSDADIVLVNLEGAVGGGDGNEPAAPKCAAGAAGAAGAANAANAGNAGNPKGAGACFALRMPNAAAAALRGLRDSGAVVVNVANNHVRDAGAAGLAHTLDALHSAGVYVTGADTLATPVATALGDTVAFLGFGSSGGPDVRDLAAVRRHVARAAARYPRLVVTMHVGAEGSGAQRTRDTMETYLDERRGNPVAFAHAAVDAGATLVVGHGPHVMRAMEWRHGALVAYSLGNLVTYGPFALGAPKNRGALLCASLDHHGRVTRAVLRATRQRPPGYVSPDRTARAAVLADSLSRLDFPETGARFNAEVEVRKP
ncbi:MAG TPA: CapA family protein [Gemmatimonadaceae bacterium]|jgi:poly-gamma-glutamate capsule biosynthesis protein CapA/YwtB (metallophosphatase superfamily)